MESESLKKFLIAYVSLGIQFTLDFRKVSRINDLASYRFCILWVRSEAIKSATLFAAHILHAATAVA